MSCLSAQHELSFIVINRSFFVAIPFCCIYTQSDKAAVALLSAYRRLSKSVTAKKCVPRKFQLGYTRLKQEVALAWVNPAMVCNGAVC